MLKGNFYRRLVLQAILHSALVVGALVFSMVLQVGVHQADISILYSGVVRGLPIALGIWLVNFSLGLYGGRSRLSLGQIRARAIMSFLCFWLIASAIFELWPLHQPYRNSYVLIVLLLTAAAMLGFRLLGKGALLQSYTGRRVLIYGAGRRAQAVGQSLERADDDSVLVGYFVGLQEDTRGAVAQGTLFSGMSLLALVKSERIDKIVVALGERRGGSMPMRELLDCKLSGIQVIDVATHFERYLGQIHLDAVSAGWLIFGDGFQQGWLRSTIKWIFDMVGAICLLLLALPVMLLAALLIFLEDGGPVFYRQERTGLGGKPFNVIKFRSMRPDAEKNGIPQWAGAADNRVTRIGKILRKLRIDELPQLLCVLCGDMSLVGPRPERPYFVEQLTQQIPYYAIRHSIKPGVTGWAQVCYHYGASIEDAQQKLQYDLYYVKNHSWFLDAIILFETVGVVLTGKGAQ